MEYFFNEGVMWEKPPFSIKINEECSEYGGNPCKHCHSHRDKIREEQIKLHC